VTVQTTKDPLTTTSARPSRSCFASPFAHTMSPEGRSQLGCQTIGRGHSAYHRTKREAVSWLGQVDGYGRRLGADKPYIFTSERANTLRPQTAPSQSPCGIAARVARRVKSAESIVVMRVHVKSTRRRETSKRINVIRPKKVIKGKPRDSCQGQEYPYCTTQTL
jgi:hypothetical protein